MVIIAVFDSTGCRVTCTFTKATCILSIAPSCKVVIIAVFDSTCCRVTFTFTKATCILSIPPSCKVVIIAVFDSTESGNAPSSPSTALFTPKMRLQNLKRDFSVVQSGLSHTLKFQMKTKLLA